MRKEQQKNYFKFYKQRFSTLFAPGLKIWSNGIPTKIDLYQSCANFCKYCYAKEMRDMTLKRNGILQNPLVARLIDMKAFVNYVNKAMKGEKTSMPFIAWALRNKYFMEAGTTGETFQEADYDYHLTDTYFNMMSELGIPIFVNTKMNLLCRDDKYVQLLVNHKAPVLLQPTFTTVDDNVAKVYEPLSPRPSERLRVCKYLNTFPHIKCASYISPFMPSITDANTEDFIGQMLDAGIVGAHLRDFYIQGPIFKSTFWKNYLKENADKLEPFPGGYHVKAQVRLDWMEKAQTIAQKRDKQFVIVGMKTKFFDLDTHYGKLVYDILPKPFQDGIVDFTAIPILRTIKRSKEPQLLLWQYLGYQKGQVNVPEYIRSNEGDINNLMDTTCNCNKSEVEIELEGYDWMVSGLWNGFQETPSGFISEVEGIYPVKENGSYMKDSDGNYIYAFLPQDKTHYLQSDSTDLFKVDAKKMKHPYVDYVDAKGFSKPNRSVLGVSDKFLKNYTVEV